MKKNKTNLTGRVAGGCIVSAGVLLLLLDGGAHVIFSCIAGTSAVLLHNMSVDDLPKDIRHKYRKEIRAVVEDDKMLLTTASVLSGLAVIINPYVGIAGLAGALLFHGWMKKQRYKMLYEELKKMGLCNATMAY